MGLLELLAAYFTVKETGRIARLKGRNPWFFQGLAVVLWLSFEFFGVLIGLVLEAIRVGFALTATTLFEPNIVALTAPAILCGVYGLFVGYCAVRYVRPAPGAVGETGGRFVSPLLAAMGVVCFLGLQWIGKTLIASVSAQIMTHHGIAEHLQREAAMSSGLFWVATVVTYCLMMAAVTAVVAVVAKDRAAGTLGHIGAIVTLVTAVPLILALGDSLSVGFLLVIAVARIGAILFTYRIYRWKVFGEPLLPQESSSPA